MKHHIYSNDLYRTFLQVTATRYSAVALAAISPVELSHDAVSCWLKVAKCQPNDTREAAKNDVVGKRGVLVADNTVIDKSRRDKIELVQWQAPK